MNLAGHSSKLCSLCLSNLAISNLIHLRTRKLTWMWQTHGLPFRKRSTVHGGVSPSNSDSSQEEKQPFTICQTNIALENHYFLAQSYGSFHKWGYSKMVGLQKIPLKWMMTGGTPMAMETFICVNSRCSSIFHSKLRSNSQSLHHFTDAFGRQGLRRIQGPAAETRVDEHQAFVRVGLSVRLVPVEPWKGICFCCGFLLGFSPPITTNLWRFSTMTMVNFNVNLETPQ